MTWLGLCPHHSAPYKTDGPLQIHTTSHQLPVCSVRHNARALASARQQTACVGVSSRLVDSSARETVLALLCQCGSSLSLLLPLFYLSGGACERRGSRHHASRTISVLLFCACPGLVACSITGSQTHSQYLYKATRQLLLLQIKTLFAVVQWPVEVLVELAP